MRILSGRECHSKVIHCTGVDMSEGFAKVTFPEGITEEEALILLVF